MATGVMDKIKGMLGGPSMDFGGGGGGEGDDFDLGAPVGDFEPIHWNYFQKDRK